MSAIKNLLVPIDGSEASASAVDFAIRLAIAYGADLTFCYSVDLTSAAAECASPYAVADIGVILDALEDQCKFSLGAAAAKAAVAGITAATIELVGPPISAIIEAAQAQRSAAIVLGTHGRRGLDRLINGSVAEGVLRRAVVPVFFASENAGAGPFKRIAVALDDSDSADAALDFALALAEPGETTIVLAHVVDDTAGAAVSQQRTTAKALLERASATLAHWNVAVEKVTLEGEPVAGLLAFERSAKVDLLAIGTHGRRGIRRLLIGSVAEGVLRASLVPVLVLRTTAPLPIQTAPAELPAMQPQRTQMR